MWPYRALERAPFDPMNQLKKTFYCVWYTQLCCFAFLLGSFIQLVFLWSRVPEHRKMLQICFSGWENQNGLNMKNVESKFPRWTQDHQVRLVIWPWDWSFGTPIYRGKPQRMAGKDLKVKNLHRKIFEKIAKNIFFVWPPNGQARQLFSSWDWALGSY